MGTFDGILSSLMSMAGGQPQAGTARAGSTGEQPQLGGLMQAALQLLQQNGGIQGVCAKFQQAGLADQAKSWVSTGANMPITADQIQRVLGSPAVSQIASKLGLSHGETSSQLAGLLPNLIDKMTPQGQVPDDHNDLVSQGLALLLGKTGRT